MNLLKETLIELCNRWADRGQGLSIELLSMDDGVFIVIFVQVYETTWIPEMEADLDFMRSVASMITIILQVIILAFLTIFYLSPSQLGNPVDTLSVGGSSSVTGVGGKRPIRGQYSGHVTCIDQSEASIQVLTNQRPVFRYWPVFRLCCKY